MAAIVAVCNWEPQEMQAILTERGANLGKIGLPGRREREVVHVAAGKLVSAGVETLVVVGIEVGKRMAPAVVEVCALVAE